MQRKPKQKLQHVRFQTTRGKVYAYFNTGKKKPNGRPLWVAMPSPSSASFWQSYASLCAAKEQRGKPGYTFANMVRDYLDSPEHAAKAEGTQKGYKSVLRAAEDLLGHFPINALDRAAIRLVLDRTDWGAGKQNLFVAAIGAVYAWGRDKDKTDATPTKGIPVMETGEHKAWPEEVVEAGMAAGGRVGLAITLLFFTGQRIGDVCKLRWSDVRGDAVFVLPEKTKKKHKVPLRIPLLNELREALAQTPKRGLTVITDELGKQIGTQPVRDEIKAFVASQGHPALRPHGLRKNAVIALLRAGCTVAEVSAITGQTFALVEYYARQISQEKMAEAAILKWEQKRPMQTPVKQTS